MLFHFLGNGGDVLWRISAAAASEIEELRSGKFSEVGRHDGHVADDATLGRQEGPTSMREGA